MPTNLETTRLILRRFTNDDLEPFLAYRSDPEVSRYQGWSEPYTRDMAEEFIRDLVIRQPGEPGEWFQWAIELRASGEMIGDCAFYLLERDPRQAEIGVTLSRAHQGSGYAREAIERLMEYLFGELGLHRVCANCDPENKPAWQILERMGFRREAHFIENLWFKGYYASEYWYAMLRREWESI
ncbi:MAG: GNAT family N-acetyltransferase [Chloroflexi bacterium RBG_16_57_11]|nr:MAG: GNAT family N-acetyltransferase [Chloroflexi bacterium RBG_16_57_11]